MSEQKPIGSYRGFDYNVDAEGTFTARKDGDKVAEAKKLTVLLRLLDKVLSAQSVGKVWIREQHGVMVEGKITSIKDERGLYARYRASFTDSEKNSRWQEFYASSFIKADERNDKLVKEINELMWQSIALEKKADAIYQKLAHYTNEELVGDPAKKKPGGDTEKC